MAKGKANNAGKYSSAKRAHYAQQTERIGKIVDARLAKQLAKQQTKQMRRSEYYKTKRTAARSAAMAGAVTASEQARQQTAQIEAKERTKQKQISIDQYVALINGEQGSQNIVNPTDQTGSPTGSWSPNDTL